MYQVKEFHRSLKFAVFAAVMATALVGSTLSAGEQPGEKREIRECIQQAREAFQAELQARRANRNGNNGHTVEAIRAAVEAFRDALADCRGEQLENDPCWQSARESFLAAMGECRNATNRRVSKHCVRAAVQAMVAELKACRGEGEEQE